MHRLFNYYVLFISFYAASFSSCTNLSTSVLCIIHAKFISSVPKEGQSKQPFPKYFVKTSLVAGYFFVTSPVLIFFVIRTSFSIFNPPYILRVSAQDFFLSPAKYHLQPLLPLNLLPLKLPVPCFPKYT